MSYEKTITSILPFDVCKTGLNINAQILLYKLRIDDEVKTGKAYIQTLGLAWLGFQDIKASCLM